MAKAKRFLDKIEAQQKLDEAKLKANGILSGPPAAPAGSGAGT